MTRSVPFSVELAHLDGCAVVVVTGEVDIATSPDMERVLSQVVESGIADVVVDMAACEFIDSTAVSVLLAANQAARSLILRSPNFIVRRAIEALGLSGVLQIEESESVEHHVSTWATHTKPIDGLVHQGNVDSDG